MAHADLYAVLGVLPGAESIVITAAYRALAQRYHPDRWQGDKAEANRRMAEINEAYRVLGDAERRAEYDASRASGKSAEYQDAEREDCDEAFEAALKEMEDRWAVALEIFPDLVDIRDALRRISSSLAFSFVTLILETKQYNSRQKIASAMERQFLERYFGRNETVLSYAKELIEYGEREAARALNRYVDVMGSDVDPLLLINRVEQQFGSRATQTRRTELHKLIEDVRKYSYYDSAKELARMLGYQVFEHQSGFLGSKTDIRLVSPLGAETKFVSGTDLIDWVRTNLCT